MPVGKTIAVVQARMGSTRLPRKMLLPLHGRPLIQWVLWRTETSNLLDGIVAAIPDTPQNDGLAAVIGNLGFDVYRGDESDVLDRFYKAAVSKNAGVVVRICADNPLISGEEIDNLIKYFGATRCDYAYNHIPKGNRYPDGLGAEIVTMDVLKRVHREASIPAHREHCMSYITDNPQMFSIKTFDPPDPDIADPSLKLDVDTEEDLGKLSALKLSINMTSREIVTLFRSAAI